MDFFPARTLALQSFLFFFLFGIFSAQAARAPGRVPSTSQTLQSIRVNLGQGKFWQIQGYDLRINKNSLLHGNSQFAIQCPVDGNEIKFGETKYASPLELTVSGGLIFLQGKPFREKLFFYNAGQGNCLVVNELDIEKYVAGLVNREMAPNWPLEALKVQAVAARTYALYQKSQSGPRAWDVESTTQDQVYTGADSETEKSSRAALETAGLVLTWQNKPIKAFYHANCAGKTEMPAAVWGNSYSYMQGVICPFHKESHAKNTWAYAISKQNLISNLRKIAGLLPAGFGALAWIQPAAANASQRVEKVLLADQKGRRAQVSTAQLREAVGNTRIRSAAFELRQSGDQLQFYGNGFGHGVGMCQIGAREMARQGKNFQAILRYYYPLASLQTL